MGGILALAHILEFNYIPDIREAIVFFLCRILARGHDEKGGGGRFLKAQKKMPRAKIYTLSKSMGFLNYTTLPTRNSDYYHLTAGQQAENFRFQSVFETPQKQILLAFPCDYEIVDHLPRRPGKLWCELDTYGVAGGMTTQDELRDNVGPALDKSCWTSELRRTVTG